MRVAMAIPVIIGIALFVFVGAQLTQGDDVPDGLEATPAPFSVGPAAEGTLVPLFPQDSSEPFIEIEGQRVVLPPGAQVVTIAGSPEIIGVEMNGSRLFWTVDGAIIENSIQPEEQAQLQPVLDVLSE